MAETTRAIRVRARELTAELGLTGFTVEELCADVGISRRTFFNYYATKEDAVIGLPVDRDGADLEALFVAAFTPGGPDRLLEDLGALVIGRLQRVDIRPEEFEIARAAFEREPRLFQSAVGHMVTDQQRDIQLVEQREGLAAGSLRASTAVRLVRTLFQASAEEYLRRGSDADITAVFAEQLDQARTLLRS